VIPLQAQFVAFNDHAPGTGTHSNATRWSCLILPTGGPLKNIIDGLDTPVTLNITRTGNGSAQGGPQAAYPQIGTPANVTFTNFVDFVGTPGAAVQITNITVHYTFSGLDPSKRYNFKGSAVRGGSGGNYTNRWTKIAITSVDSFTSQHTANIVTSSQEPTLAANEAVANFGVNLTGDMVVWDQIDPGVDGTFEVTCDFYRGPLPAPNSSTLNTPPYGYAITAIRLEEFSNVTTPIVITSGPNPSSTNIMQSDSATFDVTVTGTSPHYRWYRTDGLPISHATGTNSKTLTITNAQPSDGLPTTYRVQVTNTLNSATSGDAVLTVQPDVTPPSIISALAYLNGSNFLVGFSERLDAFPPSANGVRVHLLGGGGELPVIDIVVTNGTNLFISTSVARSAFGNYAITIDPQTAFDANGNDYPGGTTALLMEVAVLAFNNTEWKYNADGVDFGSDFAYPGFDDSAWSNGVSVFDVLRPQPPGRTTVAGFPVATQLPLTNAVYSTTTGVIPTYYYRTHFRLPTSKEHVLSLQLYTLVDDFDEFFINGQEAYRNAGYPATNPPPAFGYSGGSAVGIASVMGPFSVDPAHLINGDNLGAVIVNQANGGSSDSTFAYQLIARVDHFEAAPALTLSQDSGTGAITLTWPSGTGAHLFEASFVDAPLAGWSQVSAAADGSYTFSPTGSSPRFFTLRR
jgi:hypothetical protein